MLKTVSRIFIFTSLIFGVFLSGSAFAALGTITAGGAFTYIGSTGTLTITDATVTESDFDLLDKGDKITLTGSLGSGGTMSFSDSDVIKAVATGNIVLTGLDDSAFLFGNYTITGGAWSDYFQTDFSTHILLTLWNDQSFSGFEADYSGLSQISLSLTSVPVPSSLTLMGFGLMMLTGYRRKIYSLYFFQVPKP
nr:hypothetical protein [uncultured Desulfobacter sp.]